MAAQATTWAMETLVLSRDTNAVAMLQPILDSTGNHAQYCGDSDLAMEMLARCKFDAMFVDCDLPEGINVLRALRLAPSNRSTVAFAMGNATAAPTLFRMGATFVLEKPLDRQRARNTLRAAHGLMLLARRRYYRRAVSVPATFARSSGERLLVRTLNLSEGGAGLESSRPLELGEQGNLEFELPGGADRIRARTEVVWYSEGRLGVRFLHVANDGLNSVREWVIESFQEESRTFAGAPRFVRC